MNTNKFSIFVRMKATPTMLVCAVGSRNGTEDTKLVLMDFDGPYPQIYF